MKRKIFSVLFALVLVCSLSLVMAAPVSAVDAGVTTVVVDPSTINTIGQYTVTIDIDVNLAVTADDDVRIEFPEGTEVPAWVNTSISINGTDVDDGVGTVDVDIVGNAFTIDVPVDVPASEDVVVIFKTTAGIVNPDIVAADYTLTVSTSEEVDSVASANYAITAPEGPVDRYDDSDPMEYIDSYATISVAITNADAGDTLKVHADTYNEQVVIDEDVTLESYDGAATTIIDGSGLGSGIRALVWLQVNGITFKGFTVQNCPRTAGGAAVWVRDGGEGDPISDCVVTENIIAETNASVLSILLSHANDCEVSDNEITDSGNNGVTLSGTEDTGGGGVDNLITLNTITGSGQYGIVLTSGEDDVDFSGNVISENEISGGGRGIGIFDGNGATGAGNAIDVLDNNIHDIVDGFVIDTVPYAALGIRVHESDYVNILRNNVDNCITGIQVEGESANVVVNYNDITGNTTIGVEVLEGGHGAFDPDLDAMYNFWGEIGGPSADPLAAAADQSTALGNGDAVSQDVIYNPWLSVSYVTVVDEGIRYYGSDTLTLQAGWNTLSVPLKLYDLANSIADIEGMGDFLTAANYSDLIYEYDSVEGWVTPTTLVPCRGYYIKMLEDSNFPVLYSNSLGLPALELAAGWNLIGSAFGIDKLTDSTWAVEVPVGGAEEAEMDIGSALDSIGAQASVVVSPSAPGQIGVPWSVIWATGVTGNEMYTGEAYWVFMTASGTLAGFEITPFYFTAP